MKKILTLALAFIMILTFAACNVTPDPSGDTDAPETGSQNPGTDTASSGGTTAALAETDPAETYDITTIDGFLNSNGLTQTAVTPATSKFKDFEITSYNLETLKVTEVGGYVTEKLTEDELRAWVAVIYAALKAASDDGLFRASTSSDTELSADDINFSSSSATAGYIKKGEKNVYVIVAYPDGVYNDDPGSSVPAVTITIY